MWLNESCRRFLGRPATGRRLSPPAPRRHRLRPAPEPLEGRALLASFTASSVADLIADINAANSTGGPNTITLAPNTTFTLTALDNTTDGLTGLPVIAANDNLTIIGNGDTIERSTASGTPVFRLLDVAAGASLTLQSLTLQGGEAVTYGSGAVSAEGGAILNQGALTLDGVTVQNNIALALMSLSTGDVKAAGGGISSSGSLTLKGGTKVQNNQALGATGAVDRASGQAFPGGDGLGGGLYVAAGTVTMNNVSLTSNTARGGQGGKGVRFGGHGGGGFGGGFYVGGGTVILTNVSVTGNIAQGGAGGGRRGSAGQGEGGGLYIDTMATVCLDVPTHVTGNTASTSYRNIFGSYSTC